MSRYDVPLTTLDGAPTTLRAHEGEVLLAVDVASTYGFQERGDALTACGVACGVTFPVFGTPMVRGRGQHPLHGLLTEVADVEAALAGREPGRSRPPEER